MLGTYNISFLHTCDGNHSFFTPRWHNITRDIFDEWTLKDATDVLIRVLKRYSMVTTDWSSFAEVSTEHKIIISNYSALIPDLLQKVGTNSLKGRKNPPPSLMGRIYGVKI